jgi:hypothetical protein
MPGSWYQTNFTKVIQKKNTGDATNDKQKPTGKIHVEYLIIELYVQ